MATDRFLIGPMNSGLETNLKPFVINDDAFSRLNNAYVFRGRIRKRFGSRYVNTSGTQLNSRLRIQVGTVAAPLALPGNKFLVGQMFSVGNDTFTVVTAGIAQPMLSSNPAASGFFTTGTGAYIINHPSAATAIYWYPSQPVMGIKQYDIEGELNSPTFVFDTQFAYQYISGGFERVGTAVWTGSDSQFFSTVTWRGALPSQRYMFVVNNNAADGIKYWDGSNWTTYTPLVDNLGNRLKTAKIVTVYKGRLTFLNTTEGPLAGPNQIFVNRARWSVYGDPSAPAVDAFNQNIPGQGNFVDAATAEDIVSAQFIKDTLIVFFEASTWSLAYYGNQVQVFTWLKVNTELGAEAFASTVPFDKVVLTIGNVGIHACNGVNVERIDEKIPNFVFDIHTGTSAIERVAGIRDYFAECVYWTFPNIDADENSSTYPNQVFVYNYKTGSWAFNDDSITAFGYYFQDPTSSSASWQSLTGWDTDTPWQGATAQSQAQVILAGNQEGFMFIIDSNVTKNASVLQVTKLTTTASGQTQVTAINHNLNPDDWVRFINLNGLSVNENPTVNYRVSTVDSPDTFTLDDFVMPAVANYPLLQGADVYSGGGTMARVSKIDMLTKQFNPYMKNGQNVLLNKVDFLVDKTSDGQIAVDFMTSTGTEAQSLTKAGISIGMLMGNGILTTAPYTLAPYSTQETQQDQLWHQVYVPADGMTVQLRLYLNDDQMTSIDITESDFQLHMMILNIQRTTMRPQ